jgi:hypothetical protein
MSHFITRLKHEFLDILPVAVFFFSAFQLIAFTRDLMLEQHGIHVSTLATAAIAALIVAKVVVVVDLLPFINRFPQKPLIYNVLWKTAIYFLATFVFRYLELFLPLFFKYGSFPQANSQLLDELVWPRFWYVQIWLAVLFLMYSAIRELIRVLGRDRMVRMFFGSSGLVA